VDKIRKRAILSGPEVRGGSSKDGGQRAQRKRAPSAEYIASNMRKFILKGRYRLRPLEKIRGGKRKEGDPKKLGATKVVSKIQEPSKRLNFHQPGKGKQALKKDRRSSDLGNRSLT